MHSVCRRISAMPSLSSQSSYVAAEAVIETVAAHSLEPVGRLENELEREDNHEDHLEHEIELLEKRSMKMVYSCLFRRRVYPSI